MANRRNTQRTPPRQVPDWVTATMEDLKQLRQDTANAVGRLDNQLQIFERAFISLAQDVEYISAILDREGLLEEDGEPEGADEGYPHIGDREEFEADVERAFAKDAAEAGPEETPEEAAEAARAEAARLIAEAEAANETTAEEYNQ